MVLLNLRFQWAFFYFRQNYGARYFSEHEEINEFYKFCEKHIKSAREKKNYSHNFAFIHKLRGLRIDFGYNPE